jgi:hypothetical protein
MLEMSSNTSLKTPSYMNNLNIQFITPNNNKLLNISSSINSYEENKDHKKKFLNNPLNLRSGSINIVNGKKVG